MSPEQPFIHHPIVIIGMHRSGTSLLARLLSACGVFMGDDVQGNHESQIFMRLNDTLFLLCYATWSNPFSIHLALGKDQNVQELAHIASQILSSYASSYYAKADKNQGLKIFHELPLPWGWKDPRNSFTLPVWQQLFPNLKVIHVMRHGVDVAHSLYQRDWAAFHQDPEAYIPALGMGQDKLGLHHSRHAWTLEQTFFLWEQYVEKGHQQCAALKNQALEIRYEDLLQQPHQELQKVLTFCDIDANVIPPDIKNGVDPQRCYAYRNDPELVTFAQRWKRILAEHGYED